MNIIQQLEEKLKIPLEFNEDTKVAHLVSKDAFVKAKKLQKSPKTVAEQIIANLKIDKKIIEKIEVKGTGFINIFLTDDFLIKSLAGERGLTPQVRLKKIMVEYTDPNPFKVFHIGHLLPNLVGEGLCRVLEYVGNDVKRANYQGDVGLHVAKAIYGIVKLGGINLAFSMNLNEKVEFLGEAYAFGANAYEEDESAKLDIIELNKKIYEEDKSIMQAYDLGREWSLEKFEEIYKRLGTKFDYYYFESKTATEGKKVVEKGLEKGVFEKSEGAVVYKGGNHTRVFINSIGLPTYEAKDLGLAPLKYKDYKYDLSVIVTGNEVNEYFDVVISAMTKMYKELGKKTIHIGHGMLKLKSGKMSSRTGNIISGEGLLNMAVENVTKILSKRKDLNDEEKKVIAEQVGLSAVKYSILKTTIGKNIIFDPGADISFEGNTGPYIQYTAVRANSILEKVGKKKLSETDVKLTDTETELLLKLNQFESMVLKSSESYSLHYLCNYLYQLAVLFNSYYSQVKIDEGKNTKAYRVNIVRVVSKTITTGLELLGIKVPSKM